jgi:hypothetical protein
MTTKEKKAEIALSSKGLKLIAGINRKDFRIVSGSESFVCDRFQAAFISPRIAKLISNDSTIDTFSLTHSDSDSDSDSDSRSFSILCSLLCGDSISIDDENIIFVEHLLEDLYNFELSELVFKFVDEWKPLNTSNCISRMQAKMKVGLETTGESELIGSAFSETNIESIRIIDVCVLKDILSSDSLRISNEDWLLRMIFELGSKYFSLFGSIRFEYLSSSSIDFFFENISFEDIDSDIWHQLWIRSRHRLIYSSTELSLNRFKNCVSRTRPSNPNSDSDSIFSGLIHHLCEEFHGNVHERGVVNITCSSRCYDECWQIVNYDWNSYFYTNSSPNSWIQFDFKDRFVSLTHYALKSDGNNGYHLQEWTISGSKDGNSWTIVDDQHTQSLNGNYVTKLFECGDNSSVSEFYRYLRLTQTGKNSSGYDHLMLSNIEFFGSIVKSTTCGLMIEM